MGRGLTSRSALGAGNGDAVGEGGGSDALGSGGATEAFGDVGRSEGSARAAAGMTIGWSMTRVTSLESSAPQSVSISSVDGGVDGSVAGASLVLRGGTEDDNP